MNFTHSLEEFEFGLVSLITNLFNPIVESKQKLPLILIKKDSKESELQTMILC